MFLNNSFQTNLPPQQYSLKEKMEDKDDWGVSKWQKQCMDALEAIGRLQFGLNYDLKENYELIRGRFIFQHYLDKNDYFDLSSAISQEFNLPNYIKHYDITSKAVNVLVGEFLKRPDGFRIRANDKDSFNEFIQAKDNLLTGWLGHKVQESVTRTLAQQGIDINRDKFQNEEEAAQYKQMLTEKIKEATPPQLEEYMNNDFYTAAEKFGQHVIELSRERFNLREKEAEEFEDVLVADRCFRHFYLTATGYNQETWNPIQVFFHRSPEVKYVEDGDYVGRVYWLSKAQIVDRFGWLMTQDQIEALYPKEVNRGVGSKGIMNEAFSASIYPFEGYRDYMTQVNALGVDPHTGYPFALNNSGQMSSMDMDMLFGTGYNLNFRTDDIIQVTEAYWRSQRKIGKLNYINPETGEPDVAEVDETFDPKLFGLKVVQESYADSDEIGTVSWAWVTQIWKGVKINVNYSDSYTANDDQNRFTQRAMYIDVRPAPFQFKGEYSPFHPKLPVIGGVFNNRNGQSMSLVDLLKPYQVFYNVCMNQAYELSQREIGKFVLMDMNTMPNLKDWGGGENFEKFLAIAKSIGVGVVDTRPGANGTTAFASANSYQVMDATETDRILAKFQMATIIEQQAYKQIGITDARLGASLASKTATAVEQDKTASYAQTESYFEKFYNYKRRTLQADVEMAQHVYSKKSDITLMYTMSDLSRGYVEITDPDLILRDLGVYPTFSQEVTRQLEMIKQLALNNNTANIPLSSLAQMLTINDTRGVIQAMKEGEANFAKQQQQQQEAQKQLQEQAIQAQSEEKEKDREFEASQNQLDRENKLQIETLKGIANEGSFNPELDLTDKLIAQKDMSLKESQFSAETALSQQQLLNQRLSEHNKAKMEKEKMKHDKKLKDNEAKNKQEIEKQKLAQISAQNKSQEKISKESNDAKLTLANKQLEIKELEKEIKLIEVDKQEKKAKEEVKGATLKNNIDEHVGKIKKTEAKTLSTLKVKEAKESAKLSIDVKKKQAKQRIKDMAKPKKK